MHLTTVAADCEGLCDLSWLANVAPIVPSLDSNRALPLEALQQRPPSPAHQSIAALTELWRTNEERPPYPLTCLIALALNDSSNAMLQVKQIYSWIANNFAFYRFREPQGWQSSVRHHLTTSEFFLRIEGARHSLWTLDAQEQINIKRLLQRHSIDIELQPLKPRAGHRHVRTTRKARVGRSSALRRRPTVSSDSESDEIPSSDSAPASPVEQPAAVAAAPLETLVPPASLADPVWMSATLCLNQLALEEGAFDLPVLDDVMSVLDSL